MKSNRELASVVRRAMQDKGPNKESLGQKLNLSAVMVNKLVCGEVVPSRHLEKQMIEVLGIAPLRVTKLVARQSAKSKSELAKESRTRRAA